MDIGVTVHAPHSTEHEKKSSCYFSARSRPHLRLFDVVQENHRRVQRRRSPGLLIVRHQLLSVGSTSGSLPVAVPFSYMYSIPYFKKSAGGPGSDAQRVSSQGRHCVGERHRCQSGLAPQPPIRILAVQLDRPCTACSLLQLFCITSSPARHCRQVENRVTSSSTAHDDELNELAQAGLVYMSAHEMHGNGTVTAAVSHSH